jgi:drug/metabolite transporter (DMT)-like permease
MLVAISPAIVLGLLVLDRRRIGTNSWLRMGLVLVGLFLLVGPTGNINATGIALALVMTVFYGAFLFFVEKWLGDVPSTTITIYVDTIGAVLLVGFYLVSYRSWQPVTLDGWGIIIFTGIFTTALAHLLYLTSVKKIGSGETALINPFETIFTVLWAMFFLGERLQVLQWVGGALILLSAFLGSRGTAPDKSPAMGELEQQV